MNQQCDQIRDSGKEKLVRSSEAPNRVVHFEAGKDNNAANAVYRCEKFESVHIKIRNIPEFAVISQPERYIVSRVHSDKIKKNKKKTDHMPVLREKNIFTFFIHVNSP